MSNIFKSFPKTEAELINRAKDLAGVSIGELAGLSKHQVPIKLTKDKGFIGQLLEIHLGAHNDNLPQADFAPFAIELKTIPVDNQGRPLESTYICVANQKEISSSWENSLVKQKTSRILWVPIEANKEISIEHRRIGTPILWEPDLAISRALKQDWEELLENLALGNCQNLSAKSGQYLQLRPKAASSKQLIQIINHDGYKVSIVPKGFYLRSSLTKKILEKNYLS